MMNFEMLLKLKIDKKGASSWPALVPVPMLYVLCSNDYFSLFLFVFFLSRLNFMTTVKVAEAGSPSR